MLNEHNIFLFHCSKLYCILDFRIFPPKWNATQPYHKHLQHYQTFGLRADGPALLLQERVLKLISMAVQKSRNVRKFALYRIYQTCRLAWSAIRRSRIAYANDYISTPSEVTDLIDTQTHGFRIHAFRLLWKNETGPYPATELGFWKNTTFTQSLLNFILHISLKK